MSAGTGPGKENVPLSTPPVPVMLLTASWPPMVPFTLTLPWPMSYQLSSDAGSESMYLLWPPMHMSPTYTTHIMSYSVPTTQFALLPTLPSMVTSLISPAHPSASGLSSVTSPAQALSTQFTLMPTSITSLAHPMAPDNPTAWNNTLVLQQASFSPASFRMTPYLMPRMMSSPHYPTASTNEASMRYDSWP